MLYALLFAITAFGLRAFMERYEATNGNPALWTGLSLMTTAWLAGLSVGTVVGGLLLTGVASAVLVYRRSDRSLSVDVRIESE